MPEKFEEMSPLGKKILNHWQEHRPNYVKSLEQKRQLHQTAEQAAINHSGIFSQRMSDGLAFDQSRELAREKWIPS